MERRRTQQKNRKQTAGKLLSAEAFYSTYHGHELQHLELFQNRMRLERDAIWLAGDSSLDNKHWFPEDEAPVVNHMDRVLKEPNSCRRDVAWWINQQVEEKGYGDTLFAINTSYEEGKIESRARGQLLPQDEYLRDNVRANDSVIVSVGGNDIALFPQLPCTIINMAMLNFCTPQICLDHACGCALPCDDYVWGCSTGCLSNFCAFPFGYGYMLHLFGTRMENYIDRLTSKQRPKMIGVCAIYFPDEEPGDSWAELPLSKLGYDSNPRKLQGLIQKIYVDAISRIQVEGTKVVPIALYNALDSKNTDDYEARVEPSATGGQKMAELFLDTMFHKKMM